MPIFRWSNPEKLKKDKIVSIGLPAFKSDTGVTVCANAGICAGWCYARQGRYRQSRVKATREHNLALFLHYLMNEPMYKLVDALNADIAELPKTIRAVRIHDSGDFLTKPHIETWQAVARDNPEKKFYAYTKMIVAQHQTKRYRPDNLFIVQSFGGTEDFAIDLTQSHSRVFPDKETLKAAGYIDGSTTDLPAYEGEIKIGLIYHGGRKLTAKQINQLKMFEA